MTRVASGTAAALQFNYDPLDRVREQDDANHTSVFYGYDPLGRVTSISYPGGLTLTNVYDQLGRLTTQMDSGGRNMSYSYDVADRLVRRTYPNGVVQTNGFDNAGRITALCFFSPVVAGVTNSSIQIALSYAYDRNGNKTGGGERGTLTWPLPSLTDESTHFTAAGRVINRQIQNNSALTNQAASITYRYDSSGNMTNARGNDQSWTLAYDEDNRTIAIDWEAGISSNPITYHISNQYDALGRRFSKTVNGVTIGYVLSLTGGMERVLCDLDSTGNVTAWYIHGPDLCYKVDTNGLTCYHADAQANVIAVTDTSANMVAQYAYTPYGRCLSSTNLAQDLLALAKNPYLFVGSQGAMRELPGLYFMRARYYSAENAAFLSTDPIRHVGPGWRPAVFAYADANPLTTCDPTGLFTVFFGSAAALELGPLLTAGGSAGVAINFNSLFRAGYLAVRADNALIRGNTSQSKAYYSEWYSNIRDSIGTYTSKSGGVGAGLAGGLEGEVGAEFGSKTVKEFGGQFDYGSSSTGEGEGASISAFRSDNSHFGGSLQFGGEAGESYSVGGGTTYVNSLGDYIDAGARILEMVQLGFSDAYSHAGTLNALQSFKPSLAAQHSGMTSTGGSEVGGGAMASSQNTVFGRIIEDVQKEVYETSNSLTQSVRNIASSTGQAIGNAVTTVRNFIGGLFGGHH